MLTDDLLGSLFDGHPHPLAPLLADWLASSRRFTSFVSLHQTKIRKKLRSTRLPDGLRDLQLELETAYLLLRERTLSLVYEPQPGKLGRAPDFAVSYTTSLVFMVEVTRLRAELASSEHKVPARQSGDRPHPTHGPRLPANPPDHWPAGATDPFADMIASKLGQLAQHTCNLLVVGLDTQPPPLDELRTAMRRIQQRAEANDPLLVLRPGFRDRPEFFQYYYRLSGILMRRAPLQAGDPIILWENPQARYPLPTRVRTALARSHTL